MPANNYNIHSLRLCLLAVLLFSLPAFAQTEPATMLKPGTPSAREIAGGQKHEYQITLVANQYLRVTLDHSGFDATLTLLAPDGRELDKVEGGNDALGTTYVSAITPRLGQYRLVVESRERAEAPWRYEIKISEVRAALTGDDQRLRADHALAEGNRLRTQPGADAPRAALKKYEEALQFQRAIKNQSGEAAALQAIGRAYNDLQDRKQAIEYFQQALALRRALNDREGEGSALHNIANSYAALGDAKNAPEYYEQALKLRREIKDRRGEANTLQGLGNFYTNRGETRRALEYLEPALQISRELKQRRGQADALVGLARSYGALGQLDKAIETYNEALTVYRALGNRAGEATTTQSLALVYNRRGDRTRAIEALQQALALVKETNNRRAQAQILSNLGGVYADAGEKQQALEHLQQALELRRTTEDKLGQANTLNSIGDLFSSFGERRQALEYFQQTLALARELKSSLLEAAALNGTAVAYSALNENQQALDTFTEALPLLQTLKRPADEANVLINLGQLYSNLGDHQRALDYLQQALQLAQQVKLPFAEANALSSIGVVYHAQGEKEQALNNFKQALDRAGDRAPLITVFVLNNTMLVYRDLEQYDQAREMLDRALALAKRAGIRNAEATTLHNLGLLLKQRGESQQARATLEQTLQLNRALSDQRGEAATLLALAQLDRAEAQLDAARAKIETALDLVEALRAKVASQELRTSYFTTIRLYYDFYLDLLMELDKQRPGEGFSGLALQASERARARGLLEMLVEAHADIRQGVDAQLVKRERELQELINDKAGIAMQFKARPGTEKQVATLGRELDELTNELRQVRATIKRQSPRYATLTQPQPLTLRELQRKVLDADTLLLEYALGEARSYLWAVTPDSIRSYTLPKRAQIEEAAERVYELLTARNQQKRKLSHKQAGQADGTLSPRAADAQYWRAARELSRLVLQPVAAQLGNKRLLVVAEGALQYVPFGALPAPETGRRGDGETGRKIAASSARRSGILTPLVVRHEIISLPSASTMAVLREEMKGRQPAPKAIAIFADPVFSPNDARLQKAESQAPKNADKTTGDVARKLIYKKATEQAGEEQDGTLRIARLRFTRKEAERIMSTSAAADSTLALDFAANRAALFNEELSQYRIVHIATHGLLDTERPELSALIFSLVDEAGKPQDGFLRAHEVFNLNLPAELVVLSACETGLGKQVRGEGLVGLTRGFMYAGAARVVVSLWAVSDQATSELMAKFYRNLLKGGQRPAAALRAAQIEMWRTQRWRAPYFWAPFVMQGEWQ